LRQGAATGEQQGEGEDSYAGDAARHDGHEAVRMIEI
jgi:hypothetical protein